MLLALATSTAVCEPGTGLPKPARNTKDKIGKWKHPRWIAIITELPKTAVEKSSVSS
jgi:acyl-coenzyme A synthetase/AMP-(fatty) acid ligase